MRTQLRGYRGYSIGCALTWLVVLAMSRRVVDPDKRRAIRITCAGWWIGWLSATIARQVYPTVTAERSRSRGGS